jgi:hypothetical protein
MKRTVLLTILMALFTGCASYSHTSRLFPDSVNYTLSRDRHTGQETDYFGVSWSLK